MKESINNHTKQLQIVMENFIDPSKYKQFVILNGERFEADVAYQTIYSLANESIILVDNYIGSKTLELLKGVNKTIKIIICSDNIAKNGITDSIMDDFISCTDIDIKLIPTHKMVHDRFIVIDYQSDTEKIYLCGSSSKDSGNKITTIIEINNNEPYHIVIDKLLEI